MIEEIIVGRTYRSPSGIPFMVLARAQHGQDCSVQMVVYQNVEPTRDYPRDTLWVESESLFLTQFREFEEGRYYEQNNRPIALKREYVNVWAAKVD